MQPDILFSPRNSAYLPRWISDAWSFSSRSFNRVWSILQSPRKFFHCVHAPAVRQKLRATDFKLIFLLFMNTAPFLSQRTLSPRHIFLKFFYAICVMQPIIVQMPKTLRKPAFLLFTRASSCSNWWLWKTRGANAHGWWSWLLWGIFGTSSSFHTLSLFCVFFRQAITICCFDSS